MTEKIAQEFNSNSRSIRGEPKFELLQSIQVKSTIGECRSHRADGDPFMQRRSPSTQRLSGHTVEKCSFWNLNRFDRSNFTLE